MRGYAIVDQPRHGVANMELDQQMLQRADQQGVPIVRIYRWSEPTLSLGYFQKYTDRSQHGPSSELACVRRASGGGAIVHHHELTYSIALPTHLLTSQAGVQAAPDSARAQTSVAHPRSIGPSQGVYQTIHGSIVQGLRTLGWNAAEWDAELPDAKSFDQNTAARQTNCQSSTSTGSCSFLCFQRRSTGDVIVDGSKIMGSAQRRLGQTVLQHGSLLINVSPHAPELPGLLDIPRSLNVTHRFNSLSVGQSTDAFSTCTDDADSHATITAITLLGWIADAIQGKWGIQVNELEDWSALDIETAKLTNSKFAAREWTRKR